MHQRGQRVKGVVGADVARRLLAADVLLAGLQGEHEAASSFDIDGLADEAPGDAAHELLRHGHVAEAGAAEVHGVAERLSLADDDVGAETPGSLEEAQRERVGDDHEESPGRVRDRGRGGEVLEGPEEVGLLDDDGRRVRVDGGPDGLEVGGRAGRQVDDLRARPIAGGLAAQDLPVLGMHPGGDDDTPAPGLVPGQE